MAKISPFLSFVLLLGATCSSGFAFQASTTSEITLADSYLDSFQTKEAIKIYESLLDPMSEDPMNIHVWIQLGKAYIQGARTNDAIIHFQKLRQLSSDYEAICAEYILLARATGALISEQYEEAIHLFQEYLGINPTYVMALTRLSRCYLLTNRPRQALEYADKALAIDPAQTWVHPVRADALIGMERYEEALASLRIYISDSESRGSENRHVQRMRQKAEEIAALLQD